MLAGGVAGLTGGNSGVWAPPTVALLAAIKTEKSDHMRLQGIVYGLESRTLLAAHTQTGVINERTLPLSILVVVPAFAGMWLGLRFHYSIGADRFRKLTLIFLVVAGACILRKSLF